MHKSSNSKFILACVISASFALKTKTPSKYYNNELFEFKPNDEYTLPKDFDAETNKNLSPVVFSGDVKQAKILALENKNHGQGKFKYSLQTQNGIELTQVGKLKDEKTFVVSGSYSYTGADGKRYRVRYTADEFGYHPITELDLEIPELSPQASVQKPVAQSKPFNFNQKATSILTPPRFTPTTQNPYNDLYKTRTEGYNYDRPSNNGSPFKGSPQSPEKYYLPVY